MHIYQVKWGWYPPSLSKVESAYTEFLPSKVTLGYSRKNQDGGGGGGGGISRGIKEIASGISKVDQEKIMWNF